MPTSAEEQISSLEDQFKGLEAGMESLRKKHEQLDRSQFRANALAVAGALAVVVAVGVEFYKLPQVAAESASKAAVDATVAKVEVVVPNRVEEVLDLNLAKKVNLRIVAAEAKVAELTAKVETKNIELDSIMKKAIDRTVEFDLASRSRLTAFDDFLNKLPITRADDGYVVIEKLRSKTADLEDAELGRVNAHSLNLAEMLSFGTGTGIAFQRDPSNHNMVVVGGQGGFNPRGRPFGEPYKADNVKILSLIDGKVTKH